MAETVPLDAPWQAPNAATWDWHDGRDVGGAEHPDHRRRSPCSRLPSRPSSPSSRATSRCSTSSSTSTPPASVNALIANAGAGRRPGLSGCPAARRESRSRWPSSSADSACCSGSPVRRISQKRRARVTVHADDVTVSAKRVIVAIPPHAGGQDRLRRRRARAARPADPAGADGLADQDDRASTTRRSGATQGLNGQANSDQGPVKVTFDASPASGTPGVLLGFIDGDDARAALRPAGAGRAERGAPVLRQRYFGAAGGAARGPTSTRSGPSEIYTGGCPVGVMPAGRADRVRAGAASPGRADPLGGHRDRHGVDRLHGRRGAARASARRPRCWRASPTRYRCRPFAKPPSSCSAPTG